MKKTKSLPCLLLAIICLLLNSACEKLALESNNINTPQNNFNHFWNTLNEGYVYFDYKRVSWDSIRSVYEPKIQDNMTEQELFNVLAEMMEELRDGHNTIRSSIFNNRSFDVTNGFQTNFNKEFIIDNYLIPNNMDTTTWIRHCFLDEDIGYLYYSTFTNEITLEGMDEILTKYENTKGLIIDVRGNLGGDASNISNLMEHLVEQETLVGYTQEKTGKARDALSNPQSQSISINPNGKIYAKPIIILSNRQCFSACNTFVAYMSLLPNVTILGDQSGGGGGLPVANQLWNGWFFTYSATIGSLPDGFIYEDGIVPDVQVNTDESFEALGIDNIIEQAILVLQ